ncbi:MAG: hypothetical protein QXS41_00565 [Candidatus Woesearchaeota archaeon]
MLGIKISKDEIKECFKELKKYINSDFEFIKNEEYYIYPLIEEKTKELPERFKGKIVNTEFKRRNLTLKEILKDELTENEIQELISSFEIIGDVAIVQIPEELERKKKIIAEAVMKINKNISAVYKKASVRKGDFRTIDVEFLLGNPHTEVLHKENNCNLLLDFEKCYFSSRLSTERKRVYEEIHGKVLVMFSGIGPYAIEAAKYTCNFVYGIELNPDAHYYALRNKELNKLNNVVFLQGDVRDVVQKITKENFVRINSSDLKNQLNHQSFFLELENVDELTKHREVINQLKKNKNIILSFKVENLEAIKIAQKEKFIVYLKNEELISELVKENKLPKTCLIKYYDNLKNSIEKYQKNIVLEVKNEKELNKLEDLKFINYVITEIPIKNLERIGSLISSEDILEKSENHKFDFILMPLPKSATLFLDSALKVAKKDTIVYIYDFLDLEHIEEEKERILKYLKENNREGIILEIRKAGDFSPGVYRMLIKLKITK